MKCKYLTLLLYYFRLTQLEVLFIYLKVAGYMFRFSRNNHQASYNYSPKYSWRVFTFWDPILLTMILNMVKIMKVAELSEY
jgi:uncharacterized membrane protein